MKFTTRPDMLVRFSVQANTPEDFRAEILADLQRRIADKETRLRAAKTNGQRNILQAVLLELKNLSSFYAELVIETK